MKILVPHLYNVPGGVEKVTVSLLREIAGAGHEVVLILSGKRTQYFRSLLPRDENIIFLDHDQRETDIPMDLLYRIFLRCNRLLPEHIRKHAEGDIRSLTYKRYLRRIAGLYGASCCLYMIAAGQSPPDIRLPLYLVVHDLYWHHGGRQYDDRIKKRRDDNLKEWAESGAVFFAVSGNTAEDLRRYIAVPTGRIKVVHNAVDAPGKMHAAGYADSPGRKMLYYPAGINPQKDHFLLFRAMRGLVEKGVDLKLVLSGFRTEFLLGEKTLERSRTEKARRFYWENRHVLGQHIEARGYVSEEEMDRLYRKSTVVVMPSVYEGFGLPLSEAASRGKHVICSDIPVFREQVELYDIGNMVHFFPPNDLEAFTALVEKLLEEPPPAVDMEKLRVKFSRWTWEHVAEEYIGNMKNEQQAFKRGK